MSDPNVRWISVHDVRSSVALEREVYFVDSAKIFDEVDLDDQDERGRWRYRVLIVVANEGAASTDAQDLVDTLNGLEGAYHATVHDTYAAAREALLA